MSEPDSRLLRKLGYIDELYAADVLSHAEYIDSRQRIERRIIELQLAEAHNRHLSKVRKPLLCLSLLIGLAAVSALFNFLA